MKHQLLPISLLLIATLAGPAAEQPLRQAQARPNIILMLSDDQGWDGLSVAMDDKDPTSKSDFHQTPSLEKMAVSGMRFTRAYAPAPVCSPTRMSLQTGLNPARTGWTKAAPVFSAAAGCKLVPPASRKDIRKEETTIAELLVGAGYATAHYGKWHLNGGGPEEHGYDESDGNTGNQDAAPFTDPNPVDIFGMGERAAKFMEKSKQEKKPFFIQLSYHALHYPGNALKATVEKYSNLPAGRRHHDVERAAMTENLDTGVGRIIEAVGRLGLTDTTYLVYMSDNGGGGRGKRGGISGGKGSVREGGIRVPMIVRGPGIEEGSFCRVPVSGTDLFVTWCELAGVKEKLPEGVEGGNIAPLWSGGAETVRRPEQGLVFHFPHYQSTDGPSSALVDGNHKVLKIYESGETHLFDLEADPGESEDLSKEKPELAKELSERLERRLKEMGAKIPEPNPQYDPDKAAAARAKKGGKKDKGERGGKPRGADRKRPDRKAGR